ncbi:MAG: pyridoxal phosphate-dependent decarboxylase family protein [Acidimicrobiales bacterium]
MKPDDFRQRGHELVDWVADYLASLEERPVQAGVTPGWLRSQLPSAPPQEGEPWERIVADLERVVLPAVTHWQSPRFMAYFPSNSSPETVLGELVAAGLGQQGMLWSTSPATTELETQMCDWLADLLGLPAAFRSDGPGGGVIQDAASTATFLAVVAARHAATGGDPSRVPSLRAYTSVDAHSSVEKAVRLAGLAPTQLRRLPVDGDRRLDAEALRAAVEADVADDLSPFLVVTTVGTTSFLAVDPVGAAGAVARRHGLWHHVDAAMAGSAGVVPALRPLVGHGLDTADSYCFDPHKWLLAGMDCDVLYVADRTKLIDALSVVPEYLRNAASESGDVIDYRDWGVALGRRFRALKLWFLIRSRGADGLSAMVERHVELAAGLASRVDAHPALELVVPCRLNLVCLAHRRGDAATQRLLDAVNATGAFVTHTRLDGRLVLRVCVGQADTEARHVGAVWEAIAAAT